jgi:hypothetical protein
MKKEGSPTALAIAIIAFLIALSSTIFQTCSAQDMGEKLAEINPDAMAHQVRTSTSWVTMETVATPNETKVLLFNNYILFDFDGTKELFEVNEAEATAPMEIYGIMTSKSDGQQYIFLIKFTDETNIFAFGLKDERYVLMEIKETSNNKDRTLN